MTDYKYRIRHAQVVQVCSGGELFKRGPDQGQIHIIDKGTIVINNNGIIEDVGPDDELAAKYASSTFASDVDGSRLSVVPGLVDGHTHPVWSGDRVHEFAMKLEGATYMQIHQAGGGIGFTVRHTRDSSEQELEELLLARLGRMTRQGTTLVEVKSGYGLDVETEMKMLRVIHKAKGKVPLDIVGTFLAHSVPKGKTADEATADVLQHQITALIAAKKAGEISPELIDVFCETGVFEIDNTRKILEAGVAAGLEINFHGDELHPVKAAELAGTLGALAVSHLELVSPDGITALAKRPTFAVLLPTTAYILKLKPPPARKMIDANVPVVLASDYNPNAHCLSMPFVMNLGCILCGLTMKEALVASTINAAASLNRSKTHGSIEKGKFGDLVVVGHPQWEHLVYELVDSPIHSVVHHGSVVFKS